MSEKKRRDLHMTGAMGVLLNDLDSKPLDKPKPEESVSDASDNKPEVPDQVMSDASDKSTPRPRTGEVVELDTARVRPWAFADRPESDMGDMDSLQQSILTKGQQVPILVRPCRAKDFDYEYYAGHRRFTACAALGIPVKAIIQKVNDQDAAAVQELENKERTDLSSFAKAKHYQALLERKVFPSDSALATHLGLHRSVVNDYLQYFRIEARVLEAIKSMERVSLFSAKVISTLAKDEKNVPALIALADRIRVGTLKGNSIKKEVQKLLSGADSQSKRTIKGKAGDLFTVRNDANGTPVISVLKNARAICTTDELVDVIKKYMDEKTEEMSDASDK